MAEITPVGPGTRLTEVKKVDDQKKQKRHAPQPPVEAPNVSDDASSEVQTKIHIDERV